MAVRLGDEAPDFTTGVFNANAILRWEYRPGSTLFVVWQHGREGPGPNDTFRQSWTRDYRELFELQRRFAAVRL